MKIRTGLIAIFATAATVAGLVTAAPANAAPPSADIGYTADVVGDHVVFETDIGSLRTSGNQFEIVDAAGNVAASIPLVYNLEDRQFPIIADITGRTATLTPVQDPASATKVNVSDTVRRQVADGPQTRQERDTQALQTLGTYVTVSVAVGGLIGTIVGAAVGCVVGLLGFIAGCIPGIVTGAGVGTILGTIAVGGPTLVGAAIQFFDTINSPFTPPAN
ncbi:hypothetical protein [Gordonia rubripertincta]|uniref:DUF8020 domain-containing protein n=1 Tax=Gordonia rubripertincta TaxID=36822 RepID=A0ABT4MYI3_GORRU|nr:hypothetical protein [Gordonia rubripertincta]MCZ4552051.1 hypothetical protein [Gordonia rubripertincta]